VSGKRRPGAQSAEEFFRATAELDVDEYLRRMGRRHREGRTKLKDADLPGLLRQRPLALASSRVRERLGRLRAPDFMPKPPPAPPGLPKTLGKRQVKREEKRKEHERARRALLRQIGNAIATPERVRPPTKKTALKRLESLAHKLRRSLTEREPFKTRAEKLRTSAKTLRGFAATAGTPEATMTEERAGKLEGLADQLLALSKETFTPKHPGKKPSLLEKCRHVVARLNGFTSGPAFLKRLKEERKKPT
jgi:hypothetical protein